MRWPSGVGSVVAALVSISCASSPSDPPAHSAEHGVPEPPPEVHVELDAPPVSSAFPVPWTVRRPRLHVDVRAPAAAARERARREADGLERARRRLHGAWSFVYGETIGMAIFDRSGELILQALGGETVKLGYRVLRAPGPEPGRIQLRAAPDSAGAGPGDGRFRALFKWRSTGQVDLQVPAAGREWPEEFGRDRYRLFRDVHEAVRYLQRTHRRDGGAAREHVAD